jgi:DNA-binding XRE family transcriptional regulator
VDGTASPGSRDDADAIRTTYMTLHEAGPPMRVAPVPDTTRFLHALGSALRERREELHLTQEALSLRTGVPQRRIWELEAGVGNPTARTLLRLVAGLDTPCSRLIARAEQLAAAEVAAEPSG